MLWVKDVKNGLEADSLFGNYQFILRYIPLEYKALNDQDTFFRSTTELYRKVNQMQGYQYYILEIATKDHHTDVLKNDIQSIKEYYARIQYFSFLMQNDISLQQGDKLLPCKLFQFERDYGISPYQRFILVFPENKEVNRNNLSNRTLLYHDRVLGLKDQVKLTILGKNLNRIPSINITKPN